MNNLVSSEMTRQQKEEFATMRMNEMKLKNQKIAQRYKEVQEDRLEAEKQQAAVTAIPKTKPVTKSVQDTEEFPRSHSNPKVGREWDIGKGEDGDWSSSKEPDYDSSRNQRRGGYSSGWNNRNDSNRRPRDDYNKRENYRSYDNNKWSDSNRENVRYQNTYRGRRSENTRNYARTGPPQNWSEDPKRQFNKNQSHSSYNHQNSHSKMHPRYSHDKMWQDEGMNDVQHKQNRVENWVKSINSVDEWTENEDKNAVSTAKSFGNSTQRVDVNGQRDHEFNPQRQSYMRNKGSKYEEFPQKSNTNYSDKNYAEDHRKSTYSQEDRSNSLNLKNLKVTVSGERKSFIERQTEMHMRGKPNKYNFNHEAQNPETRRQVYTEKNNDKNFSSFGTKDSGLKSWGDQPKKRNSGNWSDDECNRQESGNWNNNKNRNQQNKKHTENWGDKSAASHPTGKSSGNWSDEEGNNQSTKKASGNWSDAECNNQPDKKDSESWTDIDSTENDTHSSQNRSNKFKKTAKQSYDVNHKKDNKFSNSYNDRYENQHIKKNVKTWKDVADHKESKQGGWDDVEHPKKINNKDNGTWDDVEHPKKINNKDNGTWDDIDDSKNFDGEAKFKGPTKYSNQGEKRNLKCTGSWGVEKFDKQNKTGGTWSGDDDNQNFERDNVNKRQYNRSSSKTFQRPNVNAEIGRSKSFQEASHKSISTKCNQKKDSGTWSDQECDNVNDANCAKWSGKWDTTDENYRVPKDDFDFQSSCSTKGENKTISNVNDFVSSVNNEEKIVDIKGINNQNSDSREVLKQSNDNNITHNSEFNSQPQDVEKNKNLDEDASKEISNEAGKNELCATLSDDNKIEKLSFNTSSNAAQISKEIPLTTNEGHLSDSQKGVSADTSEIFQQSLSEDSAFLEPCASEINDSRSSLQELEGEKSRDANDDSVLCSSSQTTKTEIEINECPSPSNLNQSDLSESNIDSGALSTTNNDE